MTTDPSFSFYPLSPSPTFMHPENSLLNHVALVLVRPKYAENIGAAARVAFNMGISRLVLVRDEMPDEEAMAKMATHKARHMLDNMEIHKDLESALAPFSVIAATTARRGRKRILEKTPRELVEAVLPDLPNNQFAIMFGPEDTGLTNEEIKYCHYVSAIPTAGFSSLNLAQAIAVHCYELYYQIYYEQTAIEPKPNIATSFELEGMYEHVEKALLKIDFLEEKSHNYWMRNVRHFLGRVKLTAKDAKIIRGICRQFLWHQDNKQ